MAPEVYDAGTWQPSCPEAVAAEAPPQSLSPSTCLSLESQEGASSCLCIGGTTAINIPPLWPQLSKRELLVGEGVFREEGFILGPTVQGTVGLVRQVTAAGAVPWHSQAGSREK